MNKVLTIKVANEISDEKAILIIKKLSILTFVTFL